MSAMGTRGPRTSICDVKGQASLKRTSSSGKVWTQPVPSGAKTCTVNINLMKRGVIMAAMSTRMCWFAMLDVASP